MIHSSAPLGEIATIERKIIGPDDIPAGIRYVGLENIDSTGAIQEVRVRNGDLASSKFSFTSKDILFGKLRPYLRKIARPLFDGICSTDIIPIRPGSKVDRGYLFYFLRQDEIVNKAASLATGINLPRISPRLLETFEVPLPPIDEQRRIVAILDQADSVRRKRRDALDQLNRLPSSIMDKLLIESDVATEKRLDELVRAQDRINYGVVQPGPEVEHGVPLVRVENVVDGDFSPLALKHISLQIEAQYTRSRLRGDEILVACVGSIGAVALAQPSYKGFNIARAVARFTIDPLKAYIIFVDDYLRQPKTQAYFKTETRAVAQPTLIIKQLSETPVSILSLAEQHLFAIHIAEIEKLKTQHRAHLTKLDALFASLQDNAFARELS